MSEKLKKSADFLKKMNEKHKKKYGASVLFKGDEVGEFAPYHTGFPTIDHINSGIGGFPRGGMTLIHGLESTGKSTLVLESIAYNMDRDPESNALYIDVENALTASFLRYKDIYGDRLDISPLNTEDGLNLAEQAIKANIYDIIVIDSLAKLESEKILEKDMGESAQRNRRAAIITEFLRRITFVLRQSNTALVCINQEIENQDRKTPYDPKTVVPCGKQQFFSANLRMQLRRSKKIKKSDGTVVGYEVEFTNLKCKISNKERARSKLHYFYDIGFMKELALLDYLVDIGYVKKLPRKLYEFSDKSIYSDTFKAKEILSIAESIKQTSDLDLFQVTPGEDFDYDVDETTADSDEEMGTLTVGVMDDE
jgi:recombination protein RecA